MITLGTVKLQWWEFGGGCGYGRNDFERRGDVSNRTRGNAGRNEETGHRVYQNGGKATRQASQSSKG